MHNLTPTMALGGVADTIGTITIVENAGVSLASVTARMGGEKKTTQVLKKLLGGVPGPGRSQQHDPEAGFWMGPDQWMIGAPMATHELLADQLKDLLGDVVELLCAIPIRTMVAGDTQRTVIHHLGCFVIRRNADDHVRILGPRASAGSLHHALTAAAHSVA